jgi:hypothetical protein
MFSNKYSEFRRPSVGSRRSTWLSRFAELLFGAIAKGTVVIAALPLIALEVLSGGMGASLSDLPATRRGWRNLFVAVLVILMIIVGGIYLFDPAQHQSRP